jgi:hypothetical protein
MTAGVLAGTAAEIAARLADAAVRARIAGRPNLIAGLGDFSRILLVRSVRYAEDVLELAYRHPLCMIGSDATTLRRRRRWRG